MTSWPADRTGDDEFHPRAFIGAEVQDATTSGIRPPRNRYRAALR